MFRSQQNNPREAEIAGRLIGHRSSILAEMYPITKQDVSFLSQFLKSLESDTVMSDLEAIPKNVPSGMNQFILK